MLSKPHGYGLYSANHFAVLNIFLFLLHINKLCLIKGYVISLYIFIMFVDYIRLYILYKLLYKNADTFFIAVEECLTKELKERRVYSDSRFEEI